jgi:peptide/nickel transport system permease protein
LWILSVIALVVILWLGWRVDGRTGDLQRILVPPGAENWLGTDSLGHDVLARSAAGLSLSASCWIIIQTLSLLLGIAFGLMAGWRAGSWLDVLLRGLMGVLWSIPMLLLLVAVVAVLGPGLPQLVLTVAAVNWVTFARLVRGETITLRRREFVLAAEAAGLPATVILWREILPHMVPPLAASVLFSTIDVVGIEAGLSFLGLGIPPVLPSLGGLLRQGMDFIASAWWLAFFPGLVLVLVILALNVAGRRLEARYRRRAL